VFVRSTLWCAHIRSVGDNPGEALVMRTREHPHGFVDPSRHRPAFGMVDCLAMRAGRRNITILHAVKFLSTLYFYHHVLTLYLHTRGLSYLEINSLWAVIVCTQAIAEIPTGVLADRFGRKGFIIIAQILQLAGEVIFYLGSEYAHFVLSAVAGGVGFSFLSGSFEAMMYDSLVEGGRESEMQRVAGLNGALSLLATVMGALVGAAVTSRLELPRYRLAIALTIATVASSAVAAIFLREPVIPRSDERRSSISIVAASVALIRTDRTLLRIVLLSMLSTPFVNYLLNLYPPHLANLGVPGGWLGVILGIASLLGFVVSSRAYLLEGALGARRALLLATVLPGMLYLALALVGGRVGPSLLVILTFAAAQAQRPIFLDYMNRRIASDYRATALSMIAALTGVYVAAMGLAIGWVADRGVRAAFVLMGAVIAAGALALRVTEASPPDERGGNDNSE